MVVEFVGTAVNSKYNQSTSKKIKINDNKCRTVRSVPIILYKLCDWVFYVSPILRNKC